MSFEWALWRCDRFWLGSSVLANCYLPLMKVLIVHYHHFELWHAPAWIQQKLAREFPQLQVVQLQNYDRVPEEVPDTDIFVGWSIRPEQFVTAERLRWI